MPEMTGSRWMAEALQKTGITHIFMMPTNLFSTLVEMEGMGITRVLAHNEKGAAYMADGYARASRRPGIVITQGGPGGPNVAAGLADGYLAHSPIISLTGMTSPGQTSKDNYQGVTNDYSNVTGFSAEVARTNRIPDLLNQAFREATSGAGGPVHLAFLGEAETGTANLPEPRIVDRFTHVPAFRPRPEPEAIQEAAQRLASAQRPVIVAGGGAITSQAWVEITELAELLSIPIATSLSGKGVIPENHPLALGVLGTYSRACSVEVVSEADLVLFIGTHAGSQVTNSWQVPPPGTPAIHIDINPSQLGKNFPVDVSVVGDAKVSVQELVDAVRALPEYATKTEWANHAQQVVREWWASEDANVNSDASPIRPERLCKELSDYLPANTMFVADTGYAGAWAGAFWELRHQGHNFIRCEGSLGWAFPGALGVKCALPDRPVLSFTGDGGLWYHLSELETAVRRGINTVTVVLNNHALVFDTHILDARFGGKAHDLSEYLDIDFGAVARSMGAFGIRVNNIQELKPALDQAFASNLPAIVDVVIDHEAYAPIRGGQTMFSSV